MACPFFLPASPVAGSISEPSPLGDFYNGECTADSAMHIIDDETLRRCCNTGYARGSCARAVKSEADAFRFLIKGDHDGVIDVAWSSERNHHPVAVGTLAVNLAAASGRDPLQGQARAYAAAYVRQIGR